MTLDLISIALDLLDENTEKIRPISGYEPEKLGPKLLFGFGKLQTSYFILNTFYLRFKMRFKPGYEGDFLECIF